MLQKDMKISAGSPGFVVGIVLYELCLAGIALFGFAMVFHIHWNRFVDYSGAVYVYLILACLETLAVLGMVPAFAAKGVVREREKKTLEVLLTTVMKPEHIIVGKLLSAVSIPVLLVVASTPVLSLVFTVGGVDKGQVAVLVAVIAWEAVFVGSIGVFLSAASRSAEYAVMMSYAASLGLCVGSAALVAAVCFVRQLYAWNILPGNGNPDVGWSLLLLLVNPIATVAGVLGGQLGYMREIYGLAGRLGSVSSFVLQNWCGLSIFFQFLLTVLFLQLSKRLLLTHRD